MPRARNIKPGFFTNEVLAELPPLTRLLFIGLWTEADREGRLEDRPRRLKMRLFPCDEFNAEQAMDDLQSSGFILRYAADGAQYVQILAWHKHQRPHYKEGPSTIPPPQNYPILGSTEADLYDRPQNPGLTQGEHRVLPPMIDPKTQGFTPYDRPQNPGSARSDTGYRIPDTGYLMPDTGSSVPPFPEKPPEPKRATARQQPEFDWSEPDPTQLIRAKVEQFAEAWLEPGNVPRAAAAAEREFVKSNSPVVEWLGKIQVSFDRWSEHHATKRFRDRKHFIPHLERWFYDGDYSRRPPGQGLAVVAAAEPACGVCGGAGMVYPDPPPELHGEARLDWLASRGASCSACGGVA